MMDWWIYETVKNRELDGQIDMFDEEEEED